MIISVASGKGGTGKTTFATNLATALGSSAQLLDCDVEEPNAHLFLNPKIDESETIYTFVPEIDGERCSGCRKCADICRYSAITVVGGKVLVFPALCHACGGCLEVCEDGAIMEGKREIGVLEAGQSKETGFIHGRLRIGEAMAPPLIRAVRLKADESIDNIIDAPPGTSCPVIASMRGVDFVVLVTEPTPFGLHDLKLAVEGVKVLGIQCGLVINRADLGDDKVQEYARREGLPILLEIPFDRKIAEAYSRGQMLVDMDGGWKDVFIGVRDRIEILAAC
ncbi:ATP-binding protein [Desulfosediminicola ganghwensis]|uniref:ATP-binding protein n=1 Tax=Desulfosediminicola ganghwensis TaxID=2569540 RepID=UPI0010ABDF9A|nr:ATP-binding protein [Desulfosediminicola ganghwensis]